MVTGLVNGFSHLLKSNSCKVDVPVGRIAGCGEVDELAVELPDDINCDLH